MPTIRLPSVFVPTPSVVPSPSHKHPPPFSPHPSRAGRAPGPISGKYLLSNARYFLSVCTNQAVRNDRQVAVGEDEPQDNAVKRFRRAVMGTGLIQEVRRRFP